MKITVKWQYAINGSTTTLLFAYPSETQEQTIECACGFRLDFNGFYTRYSLDSATRDGNTLNSLSGFVSPDGGTLRQSSSMSSLATLESTSVVAPRRQVFGTADDGEIRIPLLPAAPHRRHKSALLPPPQPRDRRHQKATHHPTSSTMNDQ